MSLDFLEAYPYPAFILHVPIPPTDGDEPPAHKIADIPFTRNMQSTMAPFHPVWSNTKWTKLVKQVVPLGECQSTSASGYGAQGTPLTKETQIGLLQMLDVDEARTFGNWISGLTDFERLEKQGRLPSHNGDHRPSYATSANHSYSSPFGQAGSSHVLPSISITENSALQQRRQFSRMDTTLESADVDSLGLLTKGTAEETDDSMGRNVEVTKPELYEAFSAILDSDLPTPSTKTPLGSTDADPRDDDILAGLTTQSTVLIKLKQPHNIWLEMIKTPLPKLPPSSVSSLLVIQVIPRSAREAQFLRQERISGPPNDSETAHMDNLLSPSLDINRVNISRPGNATHSSDISNMCASPLSSRVPEPTPTFAVEPKTRTVDRSSLSHRMESSDTISAATPLADRDDPMTAAGSVTGMEEDEETARRRKLVGEYFPGNEPLLVGDVDLGQLASFPRKTLEDPTSVESLLLSTDWSKTDLGPIEKWPSSLRTALGIVMAMPGQANLWWGKELTMIYNDHYASMVQKKHPALFGKSGAEGWAEIWADLGPVAEIVLSGTPITKDDDEFLFEAREGKQLEEYYHSWCWVPIRDEKGEIGGLLNYTRNTTKKASLSGEAVAKDVPFAILYHVVQEDLAADTSNTTMNMTDEKLSVSGSRNAPIRLKLAYGGSVGVHAGHPHVPSETTVSIRRPPRALGGLDPARTSSPTMSMISALSTPNEDEDMKTVKAENWPFKEVLQSRKPHVIEDCTDLVKGFDIRSWDALPTKACVLPICNESSSDVPSAVLIVGLNVRRAFDEEYANWLHQLRLQLYGGLLQVRSQEAERERAAELQAMDQIKSNWISGVSHELRLPLTLVSGPLDDLAREAPEGSRAKSLLTMAKRNVNRLHNLVDSLMDFSRLEAGKLKGSFRPVPIGAFTRDLAGLFRPAIERTKLKLVIDCEEDDERACFVDPDLYEKIVLNLVGNAFKYTHQGSIHVSLRYTPRSVTMSVTDTGVGIPSASMERIGERFFRVSSTGRSHEGTGIGLSLTKELIKLHGGSLAVESWYADENAEHRHGSIFTVKIPLGTSHLPTANIDEIASDENRAGRYAKGMIDEVLQWNSEQDSASLESNSESAGSAALTSGSTERTGSSLDPSTLFFTKDDVILIVDDSRDLRTWLVSLFKPYVGKVIEACDGVQGLEKAMLHKPDIIVSDVQMPRSDGFEFLQAVRAHEDIKFTPFILLTARAGESDLTTGLLTGAEDYMVKPFVSRELIARVSLQLQLGKRRRILEKAFAQRLDEVEKRRQEAEQERKRQELLIDVTSHELRNPTSAIIQCSQMVGANLTQLRQTLQLIHAAKQSLDVTEDLVDQLKADEELCRNINSCAQNQSRIADDVLALARINLDMLHFVNVPTIIRKRIQDVVKPFALEAESNGIDLVLDLNDASLDRVPYAITDPFRLGQVIVNLVGNAMRYAAEGAVQRVAVKAVISPEPPRFWARTVDFEADLPSKITACPSQKRALEDDGQVPMVEEHVAKRRDITHDVQIRVLVVEDNMINQKVLLRQLRKAGMICEAANNGQEAVNRIRQVCATESAIDAPFDVVLMDLEMPVMDGLTAIRLIREEESAGKLNRSWVFALTGNARQAQIEEALGEGMDSVIIKPYVLDEVIERIHGVCDLA
ncbi:hypothetical protein QFC21_003957 [Naganishia friedmannii]|uniref:Uncharacterized protein n=1 Tax=Naganishia friedmannii TaxID=89922 RepID=A0ACC2VLF0_9TREE|nr:hypothetical protein QFC21_003957 [Naganishia friedmannii]